MKVTIHQPNYFPYPGLFHKLSLSDVFVVMDDVKFQFDITNRNKIIGKNEKWQRITVPVKKNQTHKKIMDVEINNTISWREENFSKLCEVYDSSKFFHIYKEYFKNIYEKKWEMLVDLNLETLKKTIEWLGIKIQIIKESELNVSGDASERLVNICELMNADTYVSGIGGKNYLKEELFEEKNIKLQYQDYVPLKYKQNLSDKFISNLSIIDLLANNGNDESLKIIKNSNNLEKKDDNVEEISY